MVMPGQIYPNSWGCYLLDMDHQTLCVYQYLPSEGLKLAAARDIQYDRMLENFNTTPSPADIRQLLQQPQNSARVLQTK